MYNYEIRGCLIWDVCTYCVSEYVQNYWEGRKLSMDAVLLRITINFQMEEHEKWGCKKRDFSVPSVH